MKLDCRPADRPRRKGTRTAGLRSPRSPARRARLWVAVDFGRGGILRGRDRWLYELDAGRSRRRIGRAAAASAAGRARSYPSDVGQPRRPGQCPATFFAGTWWRCKDSDDCGEGLPLDLAQWHQHQGPGVVGAVAIADQGQATSGGGRSTGHQRGHVHQVSCAMRGSFNGHERRQATASIVTRSAGAFPAGRGAPPLVSTVHLLIAPGRRRRRPRSPRMVVVGQRPRRAAWASWRSLKLDPRNGHPDADVARGMGAGGLVYPVLYRW